MPRKLSRTTWSRAVRRVGAVGVAGAIAVGATAATASAATCPIPATTSAFTQFGDNGSYFLAPGGGFEGSLNWAHTGPASIVPGNEPFKLNAATDDQSLQLAAGGAVATAMCVTPEMTHMRFVAKSDGGGPLAVDVRFYDPLSRVIDASSATLDAADYASWTPSVNVDMRTSRLAAGTVGYVIVSFRSQGDWRVDDVFVDPFAR